MHRGYVLVWRKIQDSGLMQMPNTLTVFLHILFSATHKDIKVGTPDGAIMLNRGQYISGRKKLAEELKQSEQNIRTSLKNLEKLEILTIKTTSKYSIYTIENYDIYQNIDNKVTKPLTNSQPTANQQPTTKQTHNTQETHKYVPPIPKDLLNEWEAIRKKKKAGDITKRVIDGVIREANKLGWTLEQAVNHCCENSWQGFNSSWVKIDEKQQPSVRSWT